MKMQVIRQHHDGIDGEGVRLPRCPKGRTSCLDVIERQNVL
jgi:hypothetical protein